MNTEVMQQAKQDEMALKAPIVAKMIALFYRSLVSEGLQGELAETLTLMYAQSLFAPGVPTN